MKEKHQSYFLTWLSSVKLLLKLAIVVVLKSFLFDCISGPSPGLYPYCTLLYFIVYFFSLFFYFLFVATFVYILYNAFIRAWCFLLLSSRITQILLSKNSCSRPQAKQHVNKEHNEKKKKEEYTVTICVVKIYKTNGLYYIKEGIKIDSFLYKWNEIRSSMLITYINCSSILKKFNW